MKLSIQQLVKDESSLVLFRIRLKTLATKLGFNTISIENMQIVASEILSNQIKYANKTGMVQLWFNDERSNDERRDNIKAKKQTLSPITIDIFAMDYGPGIKDINQAYTDGYTTSHTMGKGLGSVKRMAHESDIYTSTDQKDWHGVALWSRFYRSKSEQPSSYQYGTFCRAYHDIAENGDDLWLKMNANQLSCLHLDATGHGIEAEKIVKKVRAINPEIHSKNTEQMLDITQRALTNTPGAAVVALKYNANTAQGEYSAVGDMRLLILKKLDNEAEERQLSDLKVSCGILGSASRSYSKQAFELNTDDLILSSSDGVRRNWKWQDFSELWNKHPQLICFFLGNKKGRNSDDQSIIALKQI